MEISKQFAAFSEYLNFKAGHSNLWTQFDNYNHSAPAELLLCEHSLQAGFVGNSTFSCHSVPDIWSRRICFCLFFSKSKQTQNRRILFVLFHNQNKLRIYDDSAWKIFASPGSCKHQQGVPTSTTNKSYGGKLCSLQNILRQCF